MNEKHSAAERETILTYELTDQQSLTEGVVMAVASVTEADPTTMEPLVKSIDTDALNELFAEQHDGTPRTDGRVEFDYLGYELAVNASGRILVMDSE